MKSIGRVDVPREAFVVAMSAETDSAKTVAKT